MSIGIFAATLGTKAGGMETYEQSFISALSRIDRDRRYTVYCLNNEARERLGISTPNFSFHILRPRSRWICLTATLPITLLQSKIALFHPTYVPPLLCPKPFVYTVHSSVTWTHPHFYPAPIRWRVNFLQEKGIREARMLLCVSNHVRDYVAERFKVPDERLSVVYHGVSPNFSPSRSSDEQEEFRKRHRLPERYFLYTGKLKENKNIRGLIRAFELFRSRTHSETKLVLAGRRLWSKGSLDNCLDQAAAGGHVVELGQVEHNELPILYRSAVALTFPSFWEGFGIPVLEAQASGIPVLTSNTSSLPEASGGHAILVEPESIEQIAEGMVQLDQNEALRNDLVERGLEHAKRFTWDQAARQTLGAYERSI